MQWLNVVSEQGDNAGVQARAVAAIIFRLREYAQKGTQAGRYCAA